MERLRTVIAPERYPEAIRGILEGAEIYDSRCRSGAEVLFIDRDDGYYLKSASGGSLMVEADMTSYFASIGLGAELLYFETGERDHMLTARVRGEDCTHAEYLSDPVRLCDTLAEVIYALHHHEHTDCPIVNRTESYRAAALANYRSGSYDSSAFPDSFGYASADEAVAVIEKYGDDLRSDTLIHGDCCLPNIILDDWSFSAFVDLGCGGVGDRHIDLFWCAWSLWYNLKTEKYTERFLDAYGRQNYDRDMLRVVAALEVFG